MLPETAADPYHVGNDPRLAEALMNSREVASIAAIAQEVRAAIYAGTYAPGDQLPTRAKLAKDKGVSAESVSIVMRMLASEGLVSLEQGRGTFVLPRRQHRIGLSVQRADGGKIPAAAYRSALSSLKAAVAADPAASGLEAGPVPPGVPAALPVAVTIESGGLPQSVALALGIARKALGGEGWDLDGASVQARPADEAG